MSLDPPSPELLSEIIRACGLIIKTTFSKAIGLQYSNEIIKFIIHNASTLMCHPEQGTTHVLLQINTVKSLSIFINQAGFMPTKSSEFFHQILQSGVLKEFMNTFKSLIPKDNYHANPNSLHRACLHSLAVTMHITQGDFLFQFPWKRKDSNVEVTRMNERLEVNNSYIDKIKRSI